MTEAAQGDDPVEPAPEAIPEPGKGPEGSLPDILAIIESAKARDGIESMERFVAKALPDAEAEEVQEASAVALEVIESVPVFLARARQEAEERGLTNVVVPLLNHAERYYLQPMDLIPEMTQGLPGLLDDSYLVIRIIENLDRGPEVFLDWDLEYPARFLRRLIGPVITQKLDRIAEQAQQEVSTHLAEFWDRMSHPA